MITMPAVPLRLSAIMFSWLLLTTLLGGAVAFASDDEEAVQRAFAEKYGVQIHRRTTNWRTRNGVPIMWVVRDAASPVNRDGESLGANDIITRVNGVPASTAALMKAVSDRGEKTVRITVVSSDVLESGGLVVHDAGGHRTVVLDGATRNQGRGKEIVAVADHERVAVTAVDLSPYKLLTLTDFVDEPEKYVDRGNRGYVRMPLWIGSNGITRMRDSDKAGQELIDGYGCYAADGERRGDNGEYVGNLIGKLNRGEGEINLIFANRDMARSLKDSIPVGKALRFESLVSIWSIEDNGRPIYGVSIHYLEAPGAPVFDKATMSLTPAKPIVFRADVFEKRSALRRQAEEAGSR